MLPLALDAQTAAPAAGPTATAPVSSLSDELVKMPEFQVSAKPSDPYASQAVTSVARVAGNVLDSPFTVNVITDALMSDLGANTGYDVDRYFAGVSSGRGSGIEGIDDRIDFRGFESLTRTIDNFGTNQFQANWDPAFLERQELVMGPDTILSPTGTPGGSVNEITKSPQYTRSTTVSAEVGNVSAGNFIVDTTGPINDQLAYRAIFDFQQTPTYIPGSFHQTSVGLMLSYKLWTNARIDVKYFYEDWGQRGEAANANDWGEMVYTPSTLNAEISPTTAQPGFGVQSWNGSATWSRRNDRVNFAEAQFTKPLFNIINMRLAANTFTDYWTQDSAYPSVSPGVTYNPQTGITNAITLPSTFNIQAMPVVGQYGHNLVRWEQLQNDYAANFKLGWVDIQPVAGWVYQQEHTIYAFSAQDNSAADFPPVDLLTNNGAQLVGASQHPPLSDYTHSDSNQPGFTVQKQAYAVSKVGLFDDRLYGMAGVSRVWINTVSYKSTHTEADGNDLPLFVGPYTAAPLDSQQDTYMGGLLAKPTANTSVYYAFSTNAGLTSFNNQPLWQTGKQHEFGFKTSWFGDRLQISGDHFQITQSNLSTPNPAFNLDTSQPQNLLVDANSRGYELNAVGGITRNLSIIGSITLQKYRDAFGRRVRNVPDHMADLLLNYHFRDGVFKGANIWGGVVHEGNVAGETVTGSTSLGVPEQPSFYVPAWTVINAGAGYTWDRYTIHLNIDNLANRVFFWDPASRVSVPMYDGITVRATFVIKI